MADSWEIGAIIIFGGLALVNQLVLVSTVWKIRRMLRDLAENPGDLVLDLIDGLINSIGSDAQARARMVKVLRWISGVVLSGGQDPGSGGAPPGGAGKMGKWLQVLQMLQGVLGNKQNLNNSPSAVGNETGGW